MKNYFFIKIKIPAHRSSFIFLFANILSGP